MDTAPTRDEAANRLAPAAETDVSKRQVLAVYKQMLVSLFVATVVIIAILFFLLLASYYSRDPKIPSEPPLLIVVQLAGALGAFFSALIRLYDFRDLPKALVARELEGLPRVHLVIYSMVPAVVGAIAATVIHMLFASGLLQGDLFPTFKCGTTGADTCRSFESLIKLWGPKEATDYAKDIVWGFVAGFAERLVPDTLQSLTRSAQKTSDDFDLSKTH